MKYTELPSSKVCKILLVGESGSGKTSSLISLLKAGYTLHVLDLDNGLDGLAERIRDTDPSLFSRLDVMQFSDEIRATKIGMEIRRATAFNNTLRALEHWDDETDPATWGKDHVLVLDSLTRLGDFALNAEQKANPAVGDKRQWYNAAQRRIKIFLQMITSAEFATNVIIMTHVAEGTGPSGMKKVYPTSVGHAFNSLIAAYFNTMLLSERITPPGVNKKSKYVIKTIPTIELDLKNPAPFKIEETLDAETALATVFSTLTA